MEPSRSEKYRWDIVRMDRELKIPFSETLNEIYLEMPKFVLPLHECDTLYKKWLYVLNNIEIMERLPEELNNQIFRKLKSIVEVERMTPDQRLEYELSLSVERDLSAALDTSFDDGMEKGVEKGKVEGKAEEQRLIAANFKRRELISKQLPNVQVCQSKKLINCNLSIIKNQQSSYYLYYFADFVFKYFPDQTRKKRSLLRHRSC